MGNAIFFEIGPRLDTAPVAFSNRAPSNLRILIKLVFLVLDTKCWYSFLLLFREENNGDLLFSIRVTFNFLNFYCNQWCRSLLSIGGGGGNLQFYPNFALFSTLEEMNLDHDFVQVWKFSEDQKKNASRTLFLPEFR